MDDQRILSELLKLLDANNVKIRTEPLGGQGGGLCCVKGENFFFLDSQAPARESASLCANALCKLVDLEEIYLRPEIREFIELSQT